MIITEVLTIVLVVLKLVGVIDCSWWVALSPEIIALVFYAMFVVAHLRSRSQDRRYFEHIFEEHIDPSKCDPFNRI